MVRPSFAMSNASGAYKPIIALTLPELNRSRSDATMPSGSVGSEYYSAIRCLLFALVGLRCGGDTRFVAVIVRSAGRIFPMADAYSFHIDGEWRCAVPQFNCASRRVAQAAYPWACPGHPRLRVTSATTVGCPAASSGMKRRD